MEYLLYLRDNMNRLYVPITSFSLSYDGENYTVIVRIATKSEQADCRKSGQHNPLVKLKFIRKSDGARFECFANRSEIVDKGDGDIVGFFWLSDIDNNNKYFKVSFTNGLLKEIGRVCPEEPIDLDLEEKQVLINQMNELFIEDKRNKYLYGLIRDLEYKGENLRHNEEKAYLLYPEYYRTVIQSNPFSEPLNGQKGYMFVFGDDPRKEVKSKDELLLEINNIFDRK